MNEVQSTCTQVVTQVVAQVQEVMPLFGLAFAVDAHDTCWGVTAATAGPGLASLKVGQSVSLRIVSDGNVRFVDHYVALT